MIKKLWLDDTSDFNTIEEIRCFSPVPVVILSRIKNEPVVAPMAI